MLDKQQFLEAMTFLDVYDEIRNKIEKSADTLFEDQFINFTANDKLLNIYLNLLYDSMHVEREPKDLQGNVYSNEIEYWAFEANENIYEFSEPDKNGKSIGKLIGKEKYKFWDVDMPEGKKLRIKSNSDLYDYLKAWYDLNTKK